MKIYLAGPLFTTAEQEFNAQLARSLRALGHDVFLSQENPASERTGKQIFLKDLKGLDWGAAVARPGGPPAGFCSWYERTTAIPPSGPAGLGDSSRT